MAERWEDFRSSSIVVLDSNGDQKGIVIKLASSVQLNSDRK